MKWLIEWTTGTGKGLTKVTYDEEFKDKFLAYLDERIERGTCGGYLCTSLANNDFSYMKGATA